MAKKKSRKPAHDHAEPEQKPPAPQKTASQQPQQPAPQPLPTFAAFKVLTIMMPPFNLLPASHSLTTYSHKPPTPTPVLHSLYIRPHAPLASAPSTSSTFPPNRTLFVANIPVDASEAHFTRLFRRCGTVERVVWKDGHVDLGRCHKSGSSAHVVFREEDAVRRVVEMKVRRRVWSDVVDEEEGPEGEAQGNAEGEEGSEEEEDGEGRMKAKRKGREPVGLE
ncbi:hypothetical protein HK104_004279, partial [Borealophlyctis nickersoniae]